LHDITYYIYHRSMATWSQMQSKVAGHELADVKMGSPGQLPGSA